MRKLAKDLELNPSTIAEISSKHNWQERITAFDAYIDKASQHNQVAQVKAMKRRQIALALVAQKVAEKGLKKILREMDDEQLLRKMTPEGLSRIMDTGCRLERLNRDEPEHAQSSCQSRRKGVMMANTLLELDRALIKKGGLRKFIELE